jgi:hypothetical protein
MNIEFIPLTDENIKEFVRCAKTIVCTEPKEMKSENGYFRQSLSLHSVKNDYQFKVFLRQNETFRENFSVGLIYCPVNFNQIHLFRCNGKHNTKSFANEHYHIEYHCHWQSEKGIVDGKLSKPDKIIISDKYSTFKEAVAHFMQECNITNAEEYFGESLEQSLFDVFEREEK